MDSVSYIVHLIEGPDPKRPLKHFTKRTNARAFATERVNSQNATRADIYEVPVVDTGRAVAAMQMGEGKLVESRGRPPTDEERERAAALLKNVISEDIFADDWKP